MKQRHKQYWVVVLINTFLLHHAALANPVFVPQFLSGGTGRNIRHLPCVSRRTGETGVCMFAFTCAKANGTHLGTCIDRFYFGSCCKIEEEPDAFPQDNTIDIDNPLALPKPFIITSTTPASESNDIPGNIDKVKLTTKPEGVTASVVTTLRSTSTDQVKTKPSKIASKKPVTTEFTTESIRLSTFQTVQNESEPSSTVSSINLATTSKWPQRPSISNFKPLSPRPKPVITTTTTSLISENDVTVPVYTSPSRPNVSASSSKPSSSALPSTTTIHHRNTTTHTTKKPTPTFGTKPDSTVITRPNFSTTAHRNTTVSSTVSTTHKRPSESTLKPSVTATSTQRTPPTRFPPRNATTGATFNTEKISSQTVAPSTSSASTSTASSTINITTTSKSTTRKPTTTKKFTKPTTKRPTSVTKKPSPTTVTRRPPTLITHATVHTIPPSFVTTIPPSSFTTTKDVSNLTSADSISSTPTTTRRTTKKPLTTIPNKTSTVTKRPLPTTSSVIATTVKKPTTTLRRNVTSSSTRPITTIPPKSAIATHKPTTPSTAPASITSHQPSTTVTTVTTSKITTSTTKVTKKPTKPNQSTTVTNTPRPISTTTTKTSAFTSSEVQTNIKPITQSHVPLTSVTSSSGQKNETLSPLNTTALTNEIDSEFNNEMDQTTAVPGIVTWSSLSNDVESTTKNVEYSSISPEITETSWTPITTPDGWIIIQSPTSEKTETQQESGIKPVEPTTETTLTSVKPTTESTTTKQTTTPSTTTPTTTTTTTTTTTSTTTQRATTQPTTYVDMLSTLATVTLAPEFTEPPPPALNMSNFKEVCGRRLFPEARIVGGDGSTFGKWPWQISLRQWRTSTYLHKCGAALLNENWAITAAHCVQNVLPSDLLLRIGEHDLGNEEEPYGFQERRVQIVASHPNFDPRTFEFDLALMRFYEPVLPFHPNVLPICVPDDDEDYVGQTAYVTGWGRLYEDGPLPSVLQEVAVPVINNSVCEGMYRNAGYIEHIPHIFICAGWRKGGFDSCEGDSGGPLVIQRKRDKRWILAGVISWGIGCAEPNQPGVYTRISEFREWINQILQF